MSIKNTTAAVECLHFILEHEGEDYYQQAHECGITKANWEDRWDKVEHIYVSALKALGRLPDDFN